MKFLCFGAGAVGTYLGASLANAGHQVVFLERPQTAAEIRMRGIHLDLGETKVNIGDPKVVDSPKAALELGPFDAAVIAVKSYDTANVVAPLAPFKEAVPPILCFQNGVENEAVIAAIFGEHGVIRATLTSAIARRAGGDVALERLRGVGIAAGHPLSESLVAAFDEAGLRARLYPNGAAMKWSKMLTNLMANATSAILDMTPAEIYDHPDGFYLERMQLKETLAVMDASGLAVTDLPGTPVSALAWGLRNLPAWMMRPLARKAISGGRGGKMPSFHIDLHSGAGRSEVDYLNGAVVRAGSQKQVSTPVNRLLNDTLQALTRGELPLESFAHRPDLLAAQIKK